MKSEIIMISQQTLATLTRLEILAQVPYPTDPEHPNKPPYYRLTTRAHRTLRGYDEPNWAALRQYVHTSEKMVKTS